MSDPADPGGRGELSPEERAAFKRRVEELDDKLRRVTASEQAAEEHVGDQRSAGDGGLRGQALSNAFRIGTELVVGVALGGFVGWQLDRWLGTRPWLLLLFLLIGTAAGFLNVIRAARRMQAEAEPLQRSARAVPPDDDD